MLIEAKIITVKDNNLIEISDEDGLVVPMTVDGKIPNGDDPEFSKCVRDLIGDEIGSVESATITDRRNKEGFVEGLADTFNLLVRN